MFRHKVDLVSARLAKPKRERRIVMRELSINEVEEVSGGAHWLIQGLVTAAVIKGIEYSAELASDFVADPPPTGPACRGPCHGG